MASLSPSVKELKDREMRPCTVSVFMSKPCRLLTQKRSPQSRATIGFKGPEVFFVSRIPSVASRPPSLFFALKMSLYPFSSRDNVSASGIVDQLG